MSKVFVFGIDGMSPDLLEKWIDSLPTFKKIIENGLYARIETVKPATSIAAWTSLLSGYDPSMTEVYNYTERYFKNSCELKLVNSNHIKTDMIWDVLGKNNKKTIAQGIISAYPVKPINGILIGGILTPSLSDSGVYPESMCQEILDVCGGKYYFDVSDFDDGTTSFRSLSLDELIDRVYKMTDCQIKLLKHIITTKEWDLCVYTAMGSDRFHHRLWRFVDELHIKFEKNESYKNVIKEYYIYLDRRLAEIMNLLSDDTTTMVVSDHGMNRLNGRINLNDWLHSHGYLVFNDDYTCRAKKNGPIKFSPSDIDWEKTRAFATSAYEALIFINRDVVLDNYDSLCSELENGIKKIQDNIGRDMNTQVFRTDKIYKCKPDANAPDMIVYFDNLFWGTNCDIGNNSLYSWSNLVGSDDALHSREGVCLMYGKDIAIRGKIQKQEILQITPTILELLNIERDKRMTRSIQYGK